MILIIESSPAQDLVSPRAGFRALTLLGPRQSRIFSPLRFCKIFKENRIPRTSGKVKAVGPSRPFVLQMENIRGSGLMLAVGRNGCAQPSHGGPVFTNLSVQLKQQ